MQVLNEITINTASGSKQISVVCDDIRNLDTPLDVMTVSAFLGSYSPTPKTVFEALFEKGIYAYNLAHDPLIDLRKLCNIWLSKEVKDAQIPIKHIGCIEMSPYSVEKNAWIESECKMLNSITAYFKMLEIFSLSGNSFKTLGLPILGGGYQKIPTELIIIPMLNECINLLNSVESLEKIIIITNNMQQAFTAAKALDSSYSLTKNKLEENSSRDTQSETLAFISYSSKDKNVADNLCSKLESRGIKVWYAPRNIIGGDYASAIVDAISRCSVFIPILSKDSFQSNHVLNEIDLAFNEKQGSIRFYLLKIDEEEMGSAFRYYLSRQHWMDAHCPPLEKRLDEFVDKIMSEI